MNKQEAKKLENNVLSILKKYLKKNDTIIIGISGGPDSIFLLHLIIEFQKKIPIKIIAGHVNHMLRKESNSDEIFVKDCINNLYSTGANIVLHTQKGDIKKLSKNSKKGIEETGRSVRYDFFKKLSKKYKASFITTAHHADDNLETMILNFTRGATIKGLSGMQEAEHFTKSVILLRPLLEISKKQIISYLKFKKIKFCTDKSNNSQIYKRNIIRSKIIPQLKKINPNITSTTAKNSKNLREIKNMLDEESQNWIKKNSKNKSRTKFDAKSLRNRPKAAQKNIILNIYKNCIGNTKNLENIHIEEVLEIINKNTGNKRKKLGKLSFSLKNNTINVAKISKKVQY